MSAAQTQQVDASDWGDALTALREGGLVMLDVLTAIDHAEIIEVVAHLVDPESGGRVLTRTRVPADDPRLGSLAAVFASAAWHERETAEMFGVTFVDHPDPRPLLLHAVPDVPPLLKSAPLPARLATAWPGAVEADAGRRARRPQLPPGVRAEWVREES